MSVIDTKFHWSIRMNQHKIVFLSVVIGLFLLTGCTSDNRYLIGPNNQGGDALENDGSDKIQVLFFIETDESKDKHSILVHANERLLGALTQGLYFNAAFCPGEKILRFEKREKGFHVQDTVTNTHYVNWNIPKGEDLYIGVSVNEEGTIDATPKSEIEAKEILGNIEYKTFLVNRKIDICEPLVQPLPPAAEPVKLKNIELSADALFAFDSARLKNEASKAEIDKLIAQINSAHLTITKIVVSGHTDRLGPTAYNQSLSEKRAESIVKYLITKGITSRIESIGNGSRYPVTKTQCTNTLSKKELITCLQPDRRVSVELWGSFKEKSVSSIKK